MTPAPSLTYLFGHLDTLGLAFRNPGALLLLPLAPLLFWLGRRNFPRHRLAGAARLAAYACLILALAGLALTTRLPDNRLSVVVAVDRSDSIDDSGRAWQQGQVNTLATRLAPSDELAVLAFGESLELLRPPGPPQSVDLGTANVVTSATHIERALDAAMALFPPDGARRLVLLSDGNETRGAARASIARARHAQVTILAAAPPHGEHVDVAVEKLAVARLVAERSVFPVRVIVRNSGSTRPAVLRLSVDGSVVGEEPLTLQAGLNAVEIPYRMSGPGSHLLRAEVEAAGDAVAGNNYRDASFMLGGRSRVLLVSARTDSPLASIFARKDISTTTVRPAAAPAGLDELLSYHAVILEDVPAGGIAAPQLEALERYVRDFGGGLIVVAGGDTYGDAGFKKTPIERLLPVTLESRPPATGEREPLALFILLDRSNSMGYHIRNRLERSEADSKLAYAKRAALAVVRQLKDEDRVGLIVFDSQPFEVAPLQSVKEGRAQLLDDIPRIQPGGGTDFYDSLESARRQLVASRASTGHIILLTDGDTNRAPSEHAGLIAAVARAHISVTAIRIGDDTVNLELLHDIAATTGGQFYHVENAAMLPELLLKDAHQAGSQAPRRDATFRPRLGTNSQVLRGIKPQDLPALTGYAFTRLKPGADGLLTIAASGHKDPLLAAWQYGLGRVVAFTASLDGEADAWVEWDGFGKFWSQVAHWAVREQTPWDYALEVQRADGATTLRVRTFGDLDDGVLLARLFVTPDRPTDIPLVPVAPREFLGKLPTVPGGRYPVTITARRPGSDIAQRTEFVVVPERDRSPQEEFESTAPNRALLHALATETGGTVDAPIDAIIERKPGTQRLAYPLDWWLVPAAMLLFLLDVGLRRVSIRETVASRPLRPWGLRVTRPPSV